MVDLVCKVGDLILIHVNEFSVITQSIEDLQ